MNPFVNPNKRDVSLPNGCKELIDVLQGSQTQLSKKTDSVVELFLHQSQLQVSQERKIRRFIELLLFHAQQEQATKLIIVTALPEGTTIKYKMGVWHEMTPFPSHVRRDVISELAQLAKFSAGQTIGEGVLDLIILKTRLRWKVFIATENGECKLTRIED
jgi:hypothetical protein